MNITSSKWSTTNLLLLLVISLFACMDLAQAQLTISPSYIDVAIDKGRPSGEITVTNVGDKESRYRIVTSNFAFSKTGVLLRPQINAQSLAPWIIFNPKEFTIPPKAKRTIRYAISPKGTLTAGEYWGGIELESLDTTTIYSDDGKGNKYGINVVPSVLVPVFGRYGKIRYAGAITSARVFQNKAVTALEADIANTGNGRLKVDGTFTLQNAAGATVTQGALKCPLILPMGERSVFVPITTPLPEGKYTLKISCNLSNVKVPITYETTFDWQPQPIPATPATTNPATPIPAQETTAPAEK